MIALSRGKEGLQVAVEEVPAAEGREVLEVAVRATARRAAL
jgi:hypothetical protein